MISNHLSQLKNLKPKKEFLIAIDSDGCVFDTMELKHKVCFIPNIIKHWQLQPISRYVRTAAEFINLYSKWRGTNRFPALTLVFEFLEQWPEVKERGARIPAVSSLRDWIAKESKLGNPTLKMEVDKTKDPILEQALIWSEAVNTTVADMVHHIPPFPYVKESLAKISEWADVIVCSSTPIEALNREWAENDIEKYTRFIAGQELGSKREHIQMATEGKYPKDHVLMIGDAPGDMKAAKANEVSFFPIFPGQEEKSWELFFKEIAEDFKDGNYSKSKEDHLIFQFKKLLPDVPPWLNDPKS